MRLLHRPVPPNTSVDGERDLEVMNVLGSGYPRTFVRRDHYTQRRVGASWLTWKRSLSTVPYPAMVPSCSYGSPGPLLPAHLRFLLWLVYDLRSGTSLRLGRRLTLRHDRDRIVPHRYLFELIAGEVRAAISAPGTGRRNRAR